MGRRVEGKRLNQILINMNPTENDYKSLFSIFFRVVNFCQGNGEDEDVIIMFQSAKLLEETCRELESIGETERFEAKLREFLELKGLKYVPLQFFKNASSHILSRYIIDGAFTDSKVNMAIHQFITDKSEREFHELAQNLANTHQTVETLKKIFHSPENIDRYRAEQYLEEIRKALINNGMNDVEEIHSEIVKSISNDNSLFKIFLKVLSLPSDNDIVLSIQELVALSLSKLLSDSNNISLYSCLFGCNVQDFNSAVTKWDYLIEAFLQTVRISVERLCCTYNGNTYTWTNKGRDPSLSFDQIIMLINMCKCLPGKNDKMKEFLYQIGEEGFGLFAEDVIQKCHIR